MLRIRVNDPLCYAYPFGTPVRIQRNLPRHNVQAAAPVGRWIAQQGFKAAVGGFRRDTSKERRSKTPRDTEDDI